MPGKDRACRKLSSLVSVVVVVAALVASQAPPVKGGQIQCETLPSTIRIAKEEFSNNGDLRRTCEQEVPVNRCEGTCSSRVQPSIMSPTGFSKECNCCKETRLREREIILRSCYKSDGQRLTGNQGSMTIRLHEPAECRCSRCED